MADNYTNPETQGRREWIPGNQLSPEEIAIAKEDAVDSVRFRAQAIKDADETFPIAKKFIIDSGASKVPEKKLLELLTEAHFKLKENPAAEDKIQKEFLKRIGFKNLKNAKQVKGLLFDLGLDSSGKYANVAIDEARLTKELVENLGEVSTGKSFRATLAEKIQGVRKSGGTFNRQGLDDILVANQASRRFPDANFNPETFFKGIQSRRGIKLDPLVQELKGIALGENPPTSSGASFARRLMGVAPQLDPASRTVDFARQSEAVRRPLAGTGEALRVTDIPQPRPTSYVDPRAADLGFRQPTPPPRLVTILANQGQQKPRQISKNVTAGIHNGVEFQTRKISRNQYEVVVDGVVVDTKSSQQKAINSAKHRIGRTRQPQKGFMTVTDPPAAPRDYPLAIADDLAPAVREAAGPSELAIRPRNELARRLMNQWPEPYSGTTALATIPKAVAREGLLSRAVKFGRRNPLVTGLLGGLAFEGGLAAMDAVGSVAGTQNVDDMVRQSEPSMREIIQRIYLQQRAKQGRALELKANPHLAALERHDAELAAGGVPGTVTF